MAIPAADVDPKVSELFQAMKRNKIHKWATFKIEDKKWVVVDQLGDQCKEVGMDKEKFKEFSGSLSKEPRFCLFDFDFMSKEGKRINKLVFIFWCDENHHGPMWEQMRYTSTKSKVEKAFSDVGLVFSINDRAHLDYEALRAEVEIKGA